MHPSNKSLDAYEAKQQRWLEALKAALGFDEDSQWPFQGGGGTLAVAGQGDGLGDIKPEAPSASLQEFIQRILPGALATEAKYKIPAPVTIAQAILESGQGRSGLTQKANNLFGIKARPGEPSISMSGSSWRVYSSWAESIEHHGAFLTGPRYRAQGIGTNMDPDFVARALQAAHYAGLEQDYADKLIGFMKRYDLYQYQREK